MTATIINAATSTSGMGQSAGNDGTLVIQTGATAGAQVNALTFAADGTMTPLKPMAGGSLTLGTAQNTTSGTSIDFTSIPSWAKRITLMLNGVSTNGTSVVQVQLGAGSVETSGYNAYGEGMTAGAMTASAYTSGFGLRNAQTAAESVFGQLCFTLLGSNTWVMQGNGAVTGGANAFTCGGGKTLSGTLDRLRLTTVNGTDTFDAGSVNILYEG